MATLDAALAAFPARMRPGLTDAVLRSTRDIVGPMLDRPGMAPGVALMAGLALDPLGRRLLDVELQSYAAPGADLPPAAPEVIVGGGAHAAIYCSVRVALGFPRPLVLDAAPRFGGTFGAVRSPTFYLNSRNRPGPIGAPGTRDALNVLPGAPMQPADIGGTEYQTNADLGLVVRCALALNADVRAARVESLGAVGNSPGAIVRTDRGTVAAGRVILATGIGVERRISNVEPDGRSVFSFGQWQERLDLEPFPLADLGRVAVIGNGDGARVVVESLAGIGPMASATVASLDYVERIDWYGAADLAATRDGWILCNRTRYQRLGALFPVEGRDNARVQPMGRAATLDLGYRVANVNGRPYDTVIVAAGYDRSPLDLGTFGDSFSGVDAAGRQVNPDGREGQRVGRRSFTRLEGDEVWRIGPAARLGFEANEDGRIGENAVGLFRLAPRTAALAASLPGAS